jgi:hypothetical protein
MTCIWPVAWIGGLQRLSYRIMRKIAHVSRGRFQVCQGAFRVPTVLFTVSAALLTTMFAVGCAESQVTTEQADKQAVKGLEASEAKVGHADASSRPAATLIGQRIEMSDLMPLLGEAAGVVVMEEVTIDVLARRELERRAMTISTLDVKAEEDLLMQAMERAGAPISGEVVLDMRAARGLGPARYKALLERNAMLRALVRDEAEPTLEQISQGMAVRYGDRYVMRILVAATQQEAAAIRQRLAAVPVEQRSVAFATEAFTRSTDSSNERGGLLEPISPADASYAAAVRTALPVVGVNELSSVLALDNGFAILLGVQKIAGQSPPADGEQRVRAELRARLERVAMDQLARRMLAESPPTVFDSSMNWVWSRRK